MPSRRAYVAGVTTLLGGIAGCMEASEPGGTETPTESGPTGTGRNRSPSETPTDPPADAERTVGGATVAVTDIVARKAVTYQSAMGSGGVVAPDGRQFVVASVRSDAELSLDAFALRAGGNEWVASRLADTGAVNYAVEGHEGGPVGWRVAGDGSKYVLFQLPSPLAASTPRISLRHGGESAEWALPDEALSTLTAPEPSFELDSLDAPDSVSQADPLEVSLTVTNTSGTDGRFLASVFWPTYLVADDDESHVVETSVDAGATTTQSLSIDTNYTTDEDGAVTLRVEGYVSTETEVQVTDAGTPA